MLAEPVNGRCIFSLFDLEINMSCVTDIPVDWLRICKFGLENDGLASLPLKDYANTYSLLLLQKNNAVLIEDADGERTLKSYEISLSDFTEQLIRDIKNYFDGWVSWYPAKIMGIPDDKRGVLLNALLADTEDAFRTYKDSCGKKRQF